MDGQEVNFLAVEFVDLTEVEDLEINLIDKKIY